MKAEIWDEREGLTGMALTAKWLSPCAAIAEKKDERQGGQGEGGDFRQTPCLRLWTMEKFEERERESRGGKGPSGLASLLMLPLSRAEEDEARKKASKNGKISRQTLDQKGDCTELDANPVTLDLDFSSYKAACCWMTRDEGNRLLVLNEAPYGLSR